MSDALSVVEVVLVFGGLLGWALWEIRSNRKALRESGRKRTGADGS